MKCDHCQKENHWLEIIGKTFICKKCLSLHYEFGAVYRTHIDTFHFLLRRLKPADFESYMKITRKQIEEVCDLKQIGVKFKTTNVIRLE